MRRTHKELRAILDMLFTGLLQTESASVTNDRHNASMTGLAVNKHPHITWIIIATVDGKTAVGSGVATCSLGDEWDNVLGDRIAANKALDEIEAELLGDPVDLRTRGTPGTTQAVRLLEALQATTGTTIVLVDREPGEEGKLRIYDSRD